MTRRLPAPLALALVLVPVLGVGAGCGETDTPSSPATTGSKPTPGPAEDWTEVAILTATAAGGSVSTTPTRLDDPADLDAFLAELERRGLAADVRSAVEGAEVPEGHVPVGVVIAIGCDVPPGVLVDTAGGVSVVGQKVATPMQECFAAMTSVAVLTVAESLLRG